MKKTSTYRLSLFTLFMSLFFWILLIFDPLNLMGGHSCHISATDSSHASLLSLTIGWILMVLAMMLPKLIAPIEHIFALSLKRKRISSALLFIFGYVILWTLTGLLMNMLILFFKKALPNSYLPVVVVGIIALIWQFSPIKQYFLNKGHNHRSLKAFGWTANKDAFLFGIEHSYSCIGAGWAIMWFPMLLPYGNNIAMLVVMFIMISEHMEHPRTPRWNFNLRMKLWRIVVNQTKSKLGEVY